MNIIKRGSKGPLVSFLQITLKDLGLYTSPIDGIFGTNTLDAVNKFQTSNNLITDGIVGNNTWNALLPYMNVPTTIPYTYEILMLNIKSILTKYPFI